MDLDTCSGWFNRGEPPRTYSRCVVVSHMRSGWFDYTEPPQHKGSKVGGSTIPNHLITRGSRFVRNLDTCSGWLKRGEPPRTSSNLFEPLQCRESKVRRGLAQFVKVRSGLSHEFGVVRRYRTTYSQGGQGVYVTLPIHLFRVVQPRRTSSNLLEPLQCRENNVRSGLSHEFGVVRLDRTTSSQGEEGVYGTSTPVPGGSTAANLIEPSRTSSVQQGI